MNQRSQSVSLAIPRVSAFSWLVYDRALNKVVASINPKDVREIASITKTVTAIVTVEVLADLKIDLKSMCFHISQDAIQTGTTANLCPFASMTVYDLLNGLMLPSGNDAAYALAESVGGLLYYISKGFENRLREMQKFNILRVLCQNQAQESEAVRKCGVKLFIKQMNVVAQTLGMEQTNFDNVHGLPNKYNKSTAFDVLKVANQLLCYPLLQEIICRPRYTGTMYMGERVTQLDWENTNKLLRYTGYNGIKTGQTTPAGYCLVSWYKAVDNWSFNKHDLIIVVLGSATNDMRFTDTKNLVDWYIQKRREDSLT